MYVHAHLQTHVETHVQTHVCIHEFTELELHVLMLARIKLQQRHTWEIERAPSAEVVAYEREIPPDDTLVATLCKSARGEWARLWQARERARNAEFARTRARE
eukprot:3547076-Pleurochrysis_carterae.AAC.2